MPDFSILKRLDVFSEPVRLRTTRKGSTKATLFYGSWAGLSMTILGLTLVGAMLI